jgi:hypothetical protein
MSEEQAFVEQLSAETEEEQRVSRRQFLTGAAVGGAAGLAVAAGTGVVVWNVADTQAQTELAAAQAEIERLQGLVGLYESLEGVGLDGILAAGMKALGLPLSAVEVGAKLLKSGLDLIEETLLSLEEALPTAEESILWLESQVSTVAEGIEKIETALGQALDKATDNAVAETLEEFANMILDNLPFGLGDKIRDVLTGLVTLVTSVDELVKGINSKLLEPLRQNWFSSEDGQGLGGTFVSPLVENILDPLEAHLEDLATLSDTWQQELATPAEKAMAEREKIRQEIAQYRTDNGFA